MKKIICACMLLAMTLTPVAFAKEPTPSLDEAIASVDFMSCKEAKDALKKTLTLLYEIRAEMNR